MECTSSGLHMATMNSAFFFCYDGDTLVILFNGVRKKTQKLKNSDIEKAVKLKNKYYDNKGKG